jgi:hypothetical protein
MAVRRGQRRCFSAAEACSALTRRRIPLICIQACLPLRRPVVVSNSTGLLAILPPITPLLLADVRLLRFSDRARPYINNAQFPSHRAPRPCGYAGRDHCMAAIN